MISILLVTSHTNLELYGFEVNYVRTISTYVANGSPYLQSDYAIVTELTP